MATGRIPTTANSPLTVKGDLFGYSTTQARVPVGNDGETLVADSSTSTGLRYGANFAAGKNKIINGDFGINQRAFSSTTTTATFGFDRFVLTTVDGTTTYSAQTFTPGTAPVIGYESKNYARLVSTGQTLSSAASRLDYAIEDVRTFAGQTVTVSFWAQAGSVTPSIAVELQQQFGSGGSPSSAVNAIIASPAKQTISTSWSRYSFVISVPSISGKTLGTDNNSSLRLNIWVSAGSNFDARTGSLGIQSNTFNFWGVQVEAGSTATAFQTATGTIQGELAACQRYYWRGSTTNAYGSWGGGSAASTTQANVIITLPVTMRTSPASVDFSTLRLNDTAVANAATNVTLSGDTSAQTALVNVTGTGLTTYRYNVLQNNNSTSGYIGFSAEL